MATPAELSNPSHQGYDLPNGSDLSSAANQMSDRLKERVSQARDRVTDAMSVARDRSAEFRDRAADSIQNAPFASIGVAVGLGVLIGWMLARSGSD